MSLPNELLPVGLLGTGAAGGGYEIQRSLRFNSADSAYLSRTPASAGNRKTWSYSLWIKRCKLGTEQQLLRANTGGTSTSNVTDIYFGTDNKLNFYTTIAGSLLSNKKTSQVFRDVGAWMHLVFVLDTPSGIAKIYANGSEITDWTTNTNPSTSFDSYVNSTEPHLIARNLTNGSAYGDFYLSDIHLIDGQALDPTSFGEFDTNGIWQPIEYQGEYGTNGFHLPFSDNSTASALGTDTSGNGNTWTVNNISVAAGAGNDSLVDSPTSYGIDDGLGGSVRGNYCTWNPLSVVTANGAALSNGNLDTLLANATAYGTIAIPTSGKWYFEVQTVTIFNVAGYVDGGMIGMVKLGTNSFSGVIVENGVGNYGGIYKNDVRVQTLRNAVAGDIYGVTYDADSLSMQIYRNGSVYGSAVTLDSAQYIPRVTGNGTDLGNVNRQVTNFGQRPWAFTPPEGFKALCTTNLPEPTIADGSQYMDVLLWTGNGVSPRSYSGLSFSPDLAWIKQRSSTADHALIDTVRGTSAGSLSSNLTSGDSNAGLTVDSFDSGGFTLSTGSINFSYANTNTATYVAWAWDAGTSTVTNTDGSITSQVRANPSAGFSIAVFSAGTTNAITFGHGLGVKPSLIITKQREETGNWSTYHSSLGATKGVYLNSTSAAVTSQFFWNNTEPTSSIVTGYFATGSSVAYCFAPVEGYSAFGSYTGNGSSTDGPFVYTGFRSRFILIKASSTTDIWNVVDTARSPYNAAKENLWVNQSSAEDATTSGMDILSNGFKPRNQFNYNGSGVTYIYAAFAENPFSLARAR